MSRQFTVISPSERKRTYCYDNGTKLDLFGINAIHISESGNHYLSLDNGEKTIVAPGWIAIILDIDKWTL